MNIIIIIFVVFLNFTGIKRRPPIWAVGVKRFMASVLLQLDWEERTAEPSRRQPGPAFCPAGLPGGQALGFQVKAAVQEASSGSHENRETV